MTRIVLVHGAATTERIWDDVVALLADARHDVVAPRRPGTGSLGAEIEWLAGLAAGAVVVGVSGGATLVLALATRGDHGAAGLLAHEPAGGSLAPGLFPPLAAALAAGGVDAFGAALYGPLWSRDPEVTDAAVAADLAMFRAFEPAAPATDAPPTLVTTGALSPAVRHDLAAALGERLGYATRVVPGAAHFVPRENPAALVALIGDVASGALPSGAPASGALASGALAQGDAGAT